MNKNQVAIWARRQIIEGRHLNECFASPEIQAEGWRMQHRAKRIARRIKIDPRALV